MDGKTAAEILTDPSILLPDGSDQRIKEFAKSMLLEDYEKAEEAYPDIEERIAQVKGLMSELFIHKRKKVKKQKRKPSIGGDDKEKKRVRFNISNSIYEENNSIENEESDSLYEPLS